uniref:Peptidoglycan recognition protein family domain-containing protein n=1 Tax=Clastoptera arizonana TaxID=38151 RepID=A0A1B6C2E8_9HEMI
MSRSACNVLSDAFKGNTTPESSVSNQTGSPDILVTNSSNIHVGTKNVYNNNLVFTCERGCDEEKHIFQYLRKLLRQPWVLRTVICTFIFGLAIFSFILMENIMLNNNEASFVNNETDCSYNSSINALHIVPRAEWRARPREGSFSPQDAVHTVIIGHTVTNRCVTQSSCAAQVRAIQNYQISNYGDIGYNFVIGGDGNAYCGLGWGLIGAHTYGFNTGSIGIAIIGDFTISVPQESQVQAVLMLIDQGVQSGKIKKDYKLFGQCQLQSTLSPGKNLFMKMQDWPRFRNDTLCF